MTTTEPHHLYYMRLALSLARQSPPKPTNFCVGATLLTPSADPSAPPTVTTGYTLELPGNTHAEQCCLLKLDALVTPLRPDSVLYTTMEPCNKRSPGNKPCVDRILELRDENGALAVKKVFVGVLEPGTFVGVNEGRRRLESAGVQVVKVEGETEDGVGLEEEILRVATAGHVKESQEVG